MAVTFCDYGSRPCIRSFGARRIGGQLRFPCILVFVVSLFVIENAQAAILNSLQSGTATIANGSASTTVTITSVDTTMAFVVSSHSLGSDVTADPVNGHVATQLTNATTVTFSRIGTVGAITVKWYVAEFMSGVSVQRGAQSMASGVSQNVTLTSVDTTKSFPIVTQRGSGATYGSDDFVKAKITSSTNLALDIQGSSQPDNAVEWQVVQYTNASVQTGDLSFGTGNASMTATVTSVDTAKSWLVYSYNSADGTTTNIGQKLVRGEIANATTLTFTRDNTGQGVNLTWYLITFTDTTSVQKGVQAFNTTDTSLNATITATDLSRSITVGGFYGAGGNCTYSTDDQLGVGMFRLDLTSGTNLQMTRGITGSAAADVGWFVVQFNAGQSFGYMKSITIDRTKVGVSGTPNTTLSNFPILFNCADANLKTTANGGHVTSANGYDILFRGRDDATCGGAGTAPCQLDHEIEKYDGTTGLLTAWVRIPSLNTNAASSNTSIWVYYGNSDITSSLDNPHGVWDTNYKAVWHLDDNAANTTVAEDTSNNNTDTAAANTSTKTTAGQISSALTFNGTSDYLYSTTQFTNPQGYTISAWMKTGTASGHKIVGLEQNQTGTASTTFDRMLYIGTDGKAYAATYNGGYFTATSTSAVNNSAWHYVVASFLDTGNVLRIYVDGTLNNSTNVGGQCENTTGYWRMGSYKLAGWPNASDGWFTGTIDEVRVSSTIRNADWIKTEYNNESSPCSFYSLGAEQANPPTQISLVSFTATNYSGLVQLKWKTGYEVRNLGFRIYREDRGKPLKVTKSIIAGSALFARRGVALTSGRTYTWNDQLDDPTGAVRYWLEDVDLSGKSTWHGPITPEPGGPDVPQEIQSALLSDLGKGSPATREQATVWSGSGQGETEALAASLAGSGGEHLLAQIPVHEAATGTLAVQWGLAAKPTVKILVNQEGWYRVTQPELLQAGLSPGADTANLRLYADGVEQPMLIHGGSNRRLGAADWIEFYGTGLDTPSTDTRVYWLVADNKVGKRVPIVKGSGGRSTATSFLATAEPRERTVHFAALLNGDAQNFFGSVVSTDVDTETLTLNHVDPMAPGAAQLEIGLQGTTEGGHVVAVQVNGLDAGSVTFKDEQLGAGKFTLPQSILRSGENKVSLVALNGEDDVSVVSYMRMSYWHSFEADSDALRMTLAASQAVTIEGFSSPDIRVIDVTSPLSAQEVTGAIAAKGSGFAITVAVPGAGTRKILLFTDGRMQGAAGVKANNPSSWNAAVSGADVVMISHGDFINALTPLKAQHQAEGYTVAVVDVEDVYDEFSYGAKTPQAVKDFISKARGDWKKKPRFLLLVGDASFDPRNYLGFGNFDYVPTKLIDTEYLETASDDWFADINGDGIGDIAVGRISVRTAAEAAVQVAKIVAYKQAGRVNPESWTRQVALVADSNDGFDFEQASEALLGQIPVAVTVREIFRGRMDDATARSMILLNLQSGVLLMNYFGHGSVEVWRGDLLTSADAPGLSNGTRLPFLVAMDCLNGFFDDVYTESLSEALMKAPHGGTVGVWASSGLSDPEPQEAVDVEFYRQVFRNSQTVGEAIQKAKAMTKNMDLRRTWILFGDPTLRLRF